MSYSKRIEDELKKKGIKIGDRVKVGDVEGLLMPSPEITGNPDFLVIKLDNGYNIGVKFKGKIEKSSTKEPQRIKKEFEYEVEETHAQSIPKCHDLPMISLISAGGTISSKVDYKTGAVYPSFTSRDLFAQVPELSKIVCFKELKTVSEVLSEDMCYEDWIEIAKECAYQINDGAGGVIVAHGTDTMHYTSAALSFMLSGLSKPVVLTGAQRSTDRGSADSAMNLICSAHASISDIAEVGIVMHAETDDSYCFFIRGTKARKMHTTMRNTFRPINDYPIAKIWPDGKVEPLQTYKKRTDGKVKADTKYEPNVALVKAYPNSDPTIIDYFVKKGCKGIIIEGTGLGHVPTQNKKYSWIPHVKEAVNSGVFIGIAPQTLYGKLNPDVYANGRILAYEANAVHLKDMLPETAYVKLGWVLGHTKSMKKIKDMMLTNYAGEFKERLQPDMFLY